MRAQDQKAGDRDQAAREERGDAVRRASAIAPMPTGSLGGMSAARMLALQRAVGNAVVSRLIGGDQHSHNEDRRPGPSVQRFSEPEVMRSSRTPLAPAVRADMDMEARLGADFSDTRLHTDAAAQRSAAEVGSRAYTSGGDVAIGNDGADEHTLAHELTHIVQQRSGPMAETDNGPGLKVSDPSDEFEREAETVADRAMRGLIGPVGTSPVPHAAQDGAVQRTVLAGTMTSEPARTLAELPPAWGADKPTFFTLRREKLRELANQHKMSMEAYLEKYQRELHECLIAMLADAEVHPAPTPDALKLTVKNYQNYQLQSAASSSSSSASLSGALSPEAQKLRDALVQSGRAFPLKNIEDLAKKADRRDGGGFFFELNIGRKEIEKDPRCRAQFGALGLDAIKEGLGGAELANYQPIKRGLIGADIVIWKPKGEQGKGAVSSEYAAEFIQAKSIKFASLHAQIQAARSQLEGMNASGEGAKADQREISLRGEGYSGRIALEIWDGVGNLDLLKKEAASVLTSDFVDVVVVEDPQKGEGVHRFSKDPQDKTVHYFFEARSAPPADLVEPPASRVGSQSRGKGKGKVA